jgi:hypothetical protein
LSNGGVHLKGTFSEDEHGALAKYGSSYQVDKADKTAIRLSVNQNKRTNANCQRQSADHRHGAP